MKRTCQLFLSQRDTGKSRLSTSAETVLQFIPMGAACTVQEKTDKVGTWKGVEEIDEYGRQQAQQMQRPWDRIVPCMFEEQ